MDVSKNRGKNSKWMVKIMVPNPMNKWMIWLRFSPLFLEKNTRMYPFQGGYRCVFFLFPAPGFELQKIVPISFPCRSSDGEGMLFGKNPRNKRT